MPVTFGSINGEESATVTFKVETVTIDHNSTTVHREILVLGSPQSSNGLTAVVAAPPASTEFGAVVRIASGPSSAGDLLMRPVFSSTNTDNPVRAVLSSTAADNPVTVFGTVAVTGYSTVVTVANQVRVTNSSALEFVVRPVFSSTSADNPVRAVLSSTAADNPVTVSGTVSVTGYSTIVSVANQVRVINSTAAEFVVRPVFASTATDNPVSAAQAGTWTMLIGTNMQSTVAPAQASSGLMVREVIPDIKTVASTALTSTATVIASSNATTRGYLQGYSITSTHTSIIELAFYSGSTMLWPIVLQAISSAISGANLIVPAPAHLCKAVVGRPLTLNTASTGVSVRVGVSYWIAP